MRCDELPPRTSPQDACRGDELRAAQVARDPKRSLEGLFVVEARIDAALVRVCEVGLGEAARTADTLGDILTGELDVHATEPRTELVMQLERLLELGDDVIEATRLDALRRRLGVAVHRIADPQYAGTRRADSANDAR